MSFDGILPALITPFTENLDVDTDALTANVVHLAEHGVSGFTPTGTMGEASSLSADERQLVLNTVVAAAHGLPVIAGVSASSTAAARSNAIIAHEAGCAGVMCLPPLNYAGTTAELAAYFAEVADAAKVPVMIYNNPEASGIDLPAETIAHVAKAVSAITCVKECSGDVRRIAAIRELCDINVLIGGDDYALEGYAAGADGWVTGTGNLVPRECVELQEHVRAGRMDEARKLYRQLLPLMRLDMTPHLVQYYKGAMDTVGLRGGPVRPPRLPLDPEQRGLLDAALKMLPVPSAA